jgi:3-phenylpropionate/trans-cinnamate dioxygenase ferredoxin reductase subunit
MEHEIELRRSTQVVDIHAKDRRIQLRGGEELNFDRLLLSTGAEPRRLPIEGAELLNIYYLRAFEDSEAIRAELTPGAKLVVVGAGWIGAEVAASAREKGADVTMIDPSSVPLERVLGPSVGRIYAEIHHDHGVDVRLGEGVEGFEGTQKVERVRTSGGAAIDCDFVAVGVGVTPRTQLAEAAGISIDNGITCNERLETTADGVFAAGDVANHRHPQFGRIRIEHWANALNQGLFAGKAMLGTDERYERVPYFFSDQYDISMEYSGYASGDDEVVFRGDRNGRQFIAFWVRDERVMAGMNVNIGGVTDALQALVRSGAAIDRRRLADPDQPLEELVPADEGDRPTRPRSSMEMQLGSLQPGDGAVMDVDGEKVAAYRDEQARMHAVSAICTHLQCVVDWNGDEKTWDCPCHGSRFDVEGKVLRGPAKVDLEPKRLRVDDTPRRAA